MDQYVTGSTIKALREKKKLTQKQLAELLAVSDKTISKWETQKGLPDITLIKPLAETLGVSIGELLSGQLFSNENRSANLRKETFMFVRSAEILFMQLETVLFIAVELRFLL